MGNLSPIGDYEKDRMQEIITTSVTTFTKEFAMAVPLAVVQVAKEEAAADANKLPLLLNSAPVPNEILKEGRLRKAGANNDDWTERYVVCHNASENFKIEYFDGADAKAPKKGQIFPHAYWCQDFDKDDTGIYGDCGFKLAPWWYSDRRTWYFRVPEGTPEREAEVKKWREVMQVGCRYAELPTEVDAVTGICFSIALNRTRWASGMWGWYGWYGSETERFIAFIYDVIESTILRACFAKMEVPGFLRNRVVRTVCSTVRSSIDAAVKPAVTGALEASKPIMAKVKETLQAGLQPIIDAEKNLKTEVIKLVSDAAKPAVEAMGQKVMAPMMSSMFDSISRAFVASIKGWCTVMSAKADKYTDAKYFDETVIKQSERYLDYWWSENILNQAFEILYDMDNVKNPLYRYRDCLPPTFSFSDMYWNSRGELKKLMRMALYTLKMSAEGGKITDSASCQAAITAVTGKLVHDCKVVVRVLIMGLLKGLVLWLVEDEVVKPALQAVQPVVDMVKALPEPIQPLFDIQSLLKDVIDGILMASIGNLVDTGINPTYAAIDAAGAEAGAPAL